MAVLLRLVILTVCAVAHAQYAEERAPRYIASESKVAPTPVPILKQINRHNEDGSYTYGYEGADGSFKIETKSQSGEVKGKYGYKDDTGKLRVIEYGANKYGFQPAGEGITVAPPTLVDESTREPGKSNKQYRDYDYEDPAPAPAPRPRPAQPAHRAPPPPPPQQQYRPEPQQYRPAPQQQYRSQQSAPAPPKKKRHEPQYRSVPQLLYSANPQQQYTSWECTSAPPKPAFFAGAAPAPAEDNFFNPEPQPKQYRPKQDFRPAPQPQHFAPKHTQAEFQDFNQQPRYTQANQYQEPQPQPQRGQTFSMLDQLLKEYSLPQGNSAPTHDITFGSF